MGVQDDDAALRAWLGQWGRFVAAVDFEAARELFDRSVVGFGTRAEIAVGLAALERDQWRHVWPSITGFAFDVDAASTAVADDGSQAVIWTTWGSTGRRGRATVVLRRAPASERGWLGVHTHFSLTPS